MIYMMDGRIPVEIDPDDVTLATFYLADGMEKVRLMKQFVTAGRSKEQAVCIVNCAEKSAAPHSEPERSKP